MAPYLLLAFSPATNERSFWVWFELQFSFSFQFTNKSVVFKFFLLSRAQKTPQLPSESVDFFCLNNENYLIIMIGCNWYFNFTLINQVVVAQINGKQLQLLRFEYFIMPSSQRWCWSEASCFQVVRPSGCPIIVDAISQEWHDMKDELIIIKTKVTVTSQYSHVTFK